MVLSKYAHGIEPVNNTRNHCPHSCFIIPEYMNKNILKKGTAKQREQAWKNQILTEQLRGRRQITGSLYPLYAVSDRLFRSIYDSHNNENLPGTLIRTEGGTRNITNRNKAATEAFDFSGATYMYYYKANNRNSIDGRGMKLDSTVHYGEDYNNAFWNGTQMVYGDGDGVLFERFTSSLDVVGHELTHGVTQYEAALEYNGQSGALNESLSDVFGSLVKQYTLKQNVDEADWLIGANLFTKKVKGVALRSMKEPGSAYDDPVIGKDPQPGHMKNFVKTTSDNGGVHINSGIPNRAFYLAAQEIGGYAWEKAGKIWYVTLRDRLRENSDFQDAANLTFDVACSLYGKRSREQKAVNSGWKKVGIRTQI
ncbi:MAG: M4 family metallopeptidase [Nitrososphaerales archaeon]